MKYILRLAEGMDRFDPMAFDKPLNPSISVIDDFRAVKKLPIITAIVKIDAPLLRVF